MENFTKKKTACLKEGTEKLLNKQIEREAKSSAAYLAMACWCDARGYKHAATYLYNHSDEERQHMLRIVHYLQDAGGQAIHPEITSIRQTFSSLKEIFELALEEEIKVTNAIHHITQHCLAMQDMATFNFIQWFVKEQVEEETTMRQILDLFDVIGNEGMSLYFVDKEIGTFKGD